MKLYYNSYVSFEKTLFCAAFLHNFYNYTFFVTPRADSFIGCLIVIEINTGIDITASEGHSDEIFLLHASYPRLFTVLIT